MTFFVKPSAADLRALAASNPQVFVPTHTKRRYRCDAYFVELHGGRYAEPLLVSYWYSLFSHRRADLAWKGILQVPLAPTDDADAMNALTLAATSFPIAIAP